MNCEMKKEQFLADTAGAIDELQQRLRILHEMCRQAGCELSVPVSEAVSSEARPREKQFRAVILEAIEELEESRKAFKSKRLERLRKKLTETLLCAD